MARTFFRKAQLYLFTIKNTGFAAVPCLCKTSLNVIKNSFLKSGGLQMRNQRGQGLIEYLILVAFMAIACIGVVRAINHTVNTKFQEVDYALRGTRKVIERENIDQNLSHKRDLSNFMNGVGKTGDK